MIRHRDNGGDIADLKKQAMEELSAIGVTFPVHCYHYIKSGDTTALDTATVLKQCFSDSLGDDFVVLDIAPTSLLFIRKSVTSSCTPSCRTAGALTSATPSLPGSGSPERRQRLLRSDHLLDRSRRGRPEGLPEGAAGRLSGVHRSVTEAKAIVTDTDARYAAFAKAEASMLNNALCIPCLYEVFWCLTHVNEYTKINAMYGPCNYKAVNWETRQGDGYTTEEYEAFSAAFNAATKA